MSPRGNLVLATAEARKAMSHVIAKLAFIEGAAFDSRLGRFRMRVCVGEPCKRLGLSRKVRRTKRPKVGEEYGQNETVVRPF
jgi:hypothetical protein